MRDEEYGRSLLTALISTDGIVLTLAWALTADRQTEPMLAIKIASTALLVSLVVGVLCYQFLVAASQDSRFAERSAMKAPTVAWTFFFCWLSFVFGMAAFACATWGVKSC